MRAFGYGVVLCGLSWLLMQGVHEAGHVLAALCVGAELERVVLHPLAISRTDIVHNPQPLLTIWAGPIFGSLIPLLGWFVLHLARSRFRHAGQFFAGFCLIANGVYLGFGSLEGIGDAGELLQHGVPRVALWLFSALTVPSGLVIWHRLGHRLGLADPTLMSRRADLIILWVWLLAIVVVECRYSPR